MQSFKTKLMAAAAGVAVLSLVPAMAASSALKTTPVNNNYNNAANWVAGSVPGSGQTATFNNVAADGVNTDAVYFTGFGANTTVGTFSFGANTTQHIILLDGTYDLTFTGGSGVLVSSAIARLPSFDVAVGSAINFNNGSASNTSDPTRRVAYSISGDIAFNNSTTAGSADLQIGAGTGQADFNNTSSASTAKILNNNVLSFSDSSSAASAAITNNATLNFYDNSTAGTLSTIANNSVINLNDAATLGGSTVTMGAGATVDFDDTSEGGTARILLNNSNNVGETVDFSGLSDTQVTIGSIEGGTSNDSIILDDVAVLRIGSNNFAATSGIVTLSAVISGGGASGGLDKIGTGELELRTANTFTGNVGLYAGTLRIAADNRLGNAANVVNFFGGTLKTTSTFSSARSFVLNAGGGTIETASGSLTVSGIISEAGGARTLTKTGSFDLILTDANTYTGGTNINEGRVVLGSGGATGSLSATGGVSVASDAALAFNRNNALAFTNAISGQGGVQQLGTGTTTLSGTNTYSGNTIVANGRLIAAGGSGVGDASDVYVEGSGIFEITSNETIGSLGGEGGGTVVLNANTLTLGGGSASGNDFIGDITGTGNIVKNGTYTQDFFFGGTASYTGDTTVNAGLLRIDGAVNGNVIVNSGGNLGGEFFVGGNLTNNGGNVTPGYSPGTIAVAGDYIGAGSPTYTVDILTQNQNVNNPGFGGNQDLLDVTGSYVGANTQLILNPTGTPVATTGNGIEIARFGGASSAGNFFLLSSGPQTAANGFYQGFQYVVNYVPGGTDRFFLQTQVREELVANATALASSRQLTRDCFRGTVSPAAGGKGSEGRGWLNVKVGSFNSDASNGADFDTNYNCVNGGFDVPVGENVSIGIRGGYANSDLDLSVPQGLAQLDSVTWNVEAALTYIEGAFYAGLTGGWTAHDWDYDHALASGNSSSETFDGFTGSLFAGYRASVDKDSNLTFEGLVSYDGTDCDSNCFLLGTTEDISEWEGRLLGRYDTKFGGVMPYLQVSLTHDFGEGQSVAFGNAISNVDVASLLLGANLGVSANLGGNWFGTFDLGTTQGLDSDVDGYQGSIGVKTTW